MSSPAKPVIWQAPPTSSRKPIFIILVIAFMFVLQLGLDRPLSVKHANPSSARSPNECREIHRERRISFHSIRLGHGTRKKLESQFWFIFRVSGISDLIS